MIMIAPLQIRLMSIGIDDKARDWHSASPCGDRADVLLNTFDPLIPIGAS
jgi:hypothetical protein